MSTRIGIYPGTFDPITLGHADIIRRGSKLVDKLIIGVTTNPSKNPMFSTEERFAMVEREIERLGGIHEPILRPDPRGLVRDLLHMLLHLLAIFLARIVAGNFHAVARLHIFEQR